MMLAVVAYTLTILVLRLWGAHPPLGRGTRLAGPKRGADKWVLCRESKALSEFDRAERTQRDLDPLLVVSANVL